MHVSASEPRLYRIGGEELSKDGSRRLHARSTTAAAKDCRNLAACHAPSFACAARGCREKARESR